MLSVPDHLSHDPLPFVTCSLEQDTPHRGSTGATNRVSLAATGARIVCCWLLVLCNQLLLPDCLSNLLVVSVDWMMPAAQACCPAGS